MGGGGQAAKHGIEKVCAAVALAFLAASSSAAAATGHHRLEVTLDPAGHRLAAIDAITLPSPPPGGTVRFTLHGGLSPVTSDPGVVLKREAIEAGGIGAETWSASLPAGSGSFTLRYGGPIDHPLEQVGEEYARGQKETPGSITPEGVFLTGDSSWYPSLDGRATTFSLEVSMPPGWEAVSQGERSLHERGEAASKVRWDSKEPQDDIQLMAGKWTEYRRDAGGIEAMVFLRSPDEALAGRYLEATGRYLGMYSTLIGPYPYRKWAVVENFWETGYGMPSFTLLGPQVIRFPFILTSSYPHEILHSWWGNGVGIDYGTGNWGEGLTAYLADHLIKEQQGSGAEHRQTTLQKYTDYILAGRDFPLAEFRSRHGSVTETIGYGKSMMVFHMLRLELGDAAFTDGLRRLYGGFRGKAAGWKDVRASFEGAAGRDLGTFFAQWVERAGAPVLRVREARVTGAEGRDLLLTLEQAQEGEPYRLQVPLVVTLEGKAEAVRVTVPLEGRSAEVPVRGLPARPLRVDVDPEFDLFRRLDRAEIPVALSSAFGAPKAVVVLPSDAPPPLLAAYRGLATALEGTGPGEVRTVLDTELPGSAPDASIWLLGWENRILPRVLVSLKKAGARLEKDGAHFGMTAVPRAGHSMAVAARHPSNPDLAILWIAGDDPDALPGLGRKLPHYHKYSYLGFEGKEPANVAKGRWEVADSPLTAYLGEPGVQPAMGTLEPREALASLPPSFSKERMLDAVRFLASAELEGRGFGTSGSERAVDWLAKEFAAAGLAPAGENGTFLQSWPDRGGDPERDVTLRNVLGAIPGKNSDLKGAVVVGAHHDSLGRGWPDVRTGNEGQLHPGADDDASGLAVLLELARAMAAGPPPDRPIVFAAFAAEEAGRRGSRKYTAAAALPYPARDAIGMLELDTVGRLGKGKLLVLGASSAREWVHVFRGAGFVAGVELETPSQELDASDQLSFQEIGVPAVQLTTGPHADYHRPSDTPEKLDGAGLAKVAAVAREAIDYLAGRKEPLTSPQHPPLLSTENASHHPPRPAGGERAGVRGSSSERKVSLGTVPDFAFPGPGVRITGTIPGSPAERVGLIEGDIILKVNGAAIGGMKDFSAALGRLQPGDKASVTFTRGSEERTVEAPVEAR